jgi:hypothetical protein
MVNTTLTINLFSKEKKNKKNKKKIKKNISIKNGNIIYFLELR